MKYDTSNPSHMLRGIALRLLPLLLFTSACSQKVGTPEKVGAILLTAGVAGTAISANQKKEAASTAATVASALMIPVGAAMIIGSRKATPEQAGQAEVAARNIYAALPEEKKAKLKEDEVKYLAVDTAKTEETRGEKNIMVYDVEEDKLASDKAFDVRIAPEEGSRVQFETFITEYVGGEKAPEVQP